jgi:hypothetical protein
MIFDRVPRTCLHCLNLTIMRAASSTELHFGLATLSYFLIVCYLRNVSSHDPTSIFFQPDTAFTPDYSEVRRTQAEIYVNSMPASPGRVSINPRLCVGIASVQRPDLYLDTAIGSLLEGLTDNERDDIHLITLIANADPHDHFSYHEPWLHNLADQVLTYKDLPDEQKAMIFRLERQDREHRVKPLLDYTYLLETCAATGAAYVLMLEDDVVAAGDWYHWTKITLQSLEEHQDFDRSVYLRLFYTSHLLGWNSEDWFSYLTQSVVAACVLAAVLCSLRRCHRAFSKILTGQMIGIILLVHLPACISLYFAAGRLTVAPLRNGLRPMDHFGCCSQALVFPRERIADLISFYREERTGFVDVLTELFAEKHNLRRWAHVPSVFQHIGVRSSKGDDYRGSRWNRTIAANIWNFGFEMFGKEK